MIDFSPLAEIINANNKFVLTCHVNPDADALGSELALYEVLKSLKKECRIINHSATPYNLTFMDESSVVEKYQSETHDEFITNTDVIIVLDLNQLNRIISMEKVVRQSKAVKVCIDHHLNPEAFTEYFFNHPDYSATGEIIYDFITNTGIVPINYNIALNLYAAIMTDTGSFRFDRTSPKIHNIAAHLLGLGVKPDEVYDKIYAQSRFGKQKLLGKALSSLQMNSSNEICYMILTKNDLEINGATEDDLDGFVNYCLGIEKVRIGIFFYELPNGIKISFRSKGLIPVNELAGEFGGGGHLNASGTRLFNAKLEDYIEKVISSAEKYLRF